MKNLFNISISLLKQKQEHLKLISKERAFYYSIQDIARNDEDILSIILDAMTPLYSPAKNPSPKGNINFIFNYTKSKISF